MRSPGSRAKSVRTCQGLRPRRVVWALAIIAPSRVAFRTETASAPGMSVLSRLDGWPTRSPVNASPMHPRGQLRMISGSIWLATPSSWCTTSAPEKRVLSRLNGWPMRSPVNASPMPSRAPAHELGVDAVRYSFIVMDLHHLLLAGLPATPVFPGERTFSGQTGKSQRCQKEKCDLTARRRAIEGFYLLQVF